jgi:hypothetical protein
VTELHSTGQWGVQVINESQTSQLRRQQLSTHLTQIKVQTHVKDEIQWLRGNLNFLVDSLYKLIHAKQTEHSEHMKITSSIKGINFCMVISKKVSSYNWTT